MATQRKYTLFVAAALAAAVSLLAACTSSGAHPSPSPTMASSTSTTASPTPTVDPAVAQAKTAVLEAYSGFWDAQVRALAEPTAEPPAELARFSVDKAFAGVGQALFEYKRQGIVMTGTPVLDPKVDTIELGANANAHILDCVDSTTWVPVFRDTGKPAAAPGQAPRLEVEAWAIIYDGRWVIRETNVHRDTPCYPEVSRRCSSPSRHSSLRPQPRRRRRTPARVVRRR